MGIQISFLEWDGHTNQLLGKGWTYKLVSCLRSGMAGHVSCLVLDVCIISLKKLRMHNVSAVDTVPYISIQKK